jgi:hypothetical protein
VTIDLDKLEAIARAATPGRRYLEQDRNDQWNVYAEVPGGSDREWLAILPHQCVVSIEEERARDAMLFEATSPEVVLELIRRVRAAESGLQKAVRVQPRRKS